MVRTFIAAALFLLLGATAGAYELEVMYATDHYAVNQIILGSGEKFDDKLKGKILRDIKKHDATKFQTTTGIFAAGSAGMRGKIAEPALGVVTLAAYGGQEPRLTFHEKGRHATDVGLYLPFRTLGEMVDNKILSPLLKELFKLPVIITDIPVSLAAHDFRGDLWLTARDRSAVLLDLRIIDSVYVKRAEWARIKSGCTVSALGIADHVLAEVPLLVNLHGAILSYSCTAPGNGGNQRK